MSGQARYPDSGPLGVIFIPESLPGVQPLQLELGGRIGFDGCADTMLGNRDRARRLLGSPRAGGDGAREWARRQQLPLSRMDFPDDYAVTSGDRIFHHSQDPVGKTFEAVHHQIQRSADAVTDDDAFAVSPDAWAQEIAAEFAITAPSVDTADHSFESEERIDIRMHRLARHLVQQHRVWSADHPLRASISRDRAWCRGADSAGVPVTRGGTGYKVDIHTTGLTRV